MQYSIFFWPNLEPSFFESSSCEYYLCAKLNNNSHCYFILKVVCYFLPKGITSNNYNLHIRSACTYKVRHGRPTWNALLYLKCISNSDEMMRYRCGVIFHLVGGDQKYNDCWARACHSTCKSNFHLVSGMQRTHGYTPTIYPMALWRGIWNLQPSSIMPYCNY